MNFPERFYVTVWGGQHRNKSFATLRQAINYTQQLEEQGYRDDELELRDLQDVKVLDIDQEKLRNP